MQSHSDAALVCDHVSFRYRSGALANVDISFSLRNGEIFCLLGPNGAGKTTLVRQITGLLIPSSGSIRVWGWDIRSHHAQAIREMGVIPQEVGLFGSLTVEQHLHYLAPLKGLARTHRDRAIADVATECALHSIYGSRVSQLSVGQRRRVLLAIALLGDPRMLVLDEPTVGMDPVSRRALWATLEKQRAMGKTIVLTTHYLDEAERLSDRIAVIDKGTIQALATLPELLQQFGRAIKVSVFDPASNRLISQNFFATKDEAHRYIAQGNYTSFSMGNVTLEDVYLSRFDKTLNDEKEPASVCA